jgi:hypothetical protein
MERMDKIACLKSISIGSTYLREEELLEDLKMDGLIAFGA